MSNSSQTTKSFSNISTTCNSSDGGIWIPQQSIPQIGATPSGILSNNCVLDAKNNKLNENEVHQKTNLSLFLNGGGRAAAEKPTLPLFGATAATNIQSLTQNSFLPFETFSTNSIVANSTTAALINLHVANKCQSLLQSSTNTPSTAAAVSFAPFNIAAQPNSTATLIQFQENLKPNNLKIKNTLKEKKSAHSLKSIKNKTLDSENLKKFKTQSTNIKKSSIANNDQFDITSKVIFF